jgi:hypothetical protein
MRKSAIAGRRIYARPSRFVLFLKGILLTAVLIVFVLLMQGTWSMAKSMWQILPESAPPVTRTAQPIYYEPEKPAQDFEYSKI